MDSGIGGSHSSMIDETSSEIETERRSASYYRDNEKCGTSLKRWGDKGLKSSLSFSDVYMEFANTSSNNLSPEYSASCPDLEDIFNSSKHSFQHNDENLKALEECQAQTKMDFEQEEEKKIECLKEEEISVPNVSSIKDQRSYFQRNYKKFIKDLEPSNKLMDEIISFECRDKYLSERIREAKSRKRRADILIKYAARYLDKDSFESLLKKADHAHLINKLKTGSTQEACTPTGTEVEDRSHLLCNEQFKQLLMDEIEPLDIIDSLVVNEVLSFVDHEDILVTNFRRTRVENLMKYIDRNPERNFIYFFKLLKKYYRHVIEQFDTRDTAADTFYELFV